MHTITRHHQGMIMGTDKPKTEPWMREAAQRLIATEPETRAQINKEIQDSAVPCAWDDQGNPIDWKRPLREGYDSVLDMPVVLPPEAMQTLRKRLIEKRQSDGITVVSDETLYPNG